MPDTETNHDDLLAEIEIELTAAGLKTEGLIAFLRSLNELQIDWSVDVNKRYLADGWERWIHDPDKVVLNVGDDDDAGLCPYCFEELRDAAVAKAKASTGPD